MLEEFGTNLVTRTDSPSTLKSECKPTGRDVSVDNTDHTYQQWAIAGSGKHIPTYATSKILSPGMYRFFYTGDGTPVFMAQTICVDQLIDLPNSKSCEVIEEIKTFWTLKEKFDEYHFLHRRGYLLYGPAGSGKTVVVQQIVHNCIENGYLALLCECPKTLQSGLQILREVEPTRRIVCLFEDVDAIVHSYGEDDLLSLLDGEGQLNDVLNIATTNYPERLDKRIVSRPRRFDRVIKINMPTAPMRKTYLSKKLNINGDDLLNWVEKTEGLSFAALAELVISVKCLGNQFDETLRILRSMAMQKASSSEFDNSKIGFVEGT